jgi:glycosyltransferase involved in cell wall biosynthesis
MLRGRSLIYFGPGPWEGMWRNRHQLLSRFARHNQVLYVETPHYFQRLRQLVRKSGWPGLKQLAQKSGAQHIEAGLYVYRSPVTAPLMGRAVLETASQQLWVLALRATLQRLHFDNPILWLARPEWHWVLGKFSERLSIYHVVDEYTAYQDLTAGDVERIRQQEEQLLPQVDLVITVSSSLYDAKQRNNPHTYWVANAVDAEAFQHPPSPLPLEVVGLKPPRLIYAGLIGARLDLVLLVTLARRRPDWSLVLLGEVNATGAEQTLNELRSLANVHFLGLKPAQRVSAYLAVCEVCVLPYRQDDEAQHIDPLKLYEGLAAGKPIVMTPIPAAQAFHEVIRTASTVEEMEQQVLVALQETSPECVAQRRASVSKHTWEARVEQLSGLIAERLVATG